MFSTPLVLLFWVICQFVYDFSRFFICLNLLLRAFFLGFIKFFFFFSGFLLGTSRLRRHETKGIHVRPEAKVVCCFL